MTEQEYRLRVVNAAQAWLGAVKGDARHREIIDLYNTIKPLPRGVRMSYTMDWCAATVSAVFQAAGLIDLIPPECSCGLMLRGAQRMGIWVEKDDYRPQLGDIVLYDWQDTGVGGNTGAPDHVGIVTNLEGDKFCVTEGNMGPPSHVGTRNMYINGRFIRGFICPDFASMATADKPEPWYAKAVAYCKEKGYMEDDTRPLDGITRAEVAQVIYNIMGKEDK